jgi:hypothetical protein
MLGIAATFADKAAIRAHVGEAFGNGELTDDLAPPLERGRLLRPYNDCLVLSILLAPYESRLDEVLFPKAPFGFDAGPCAYLREVAGGREQPGANVPYPRYLFGSRTLVAPLVSALSIHAARQTLYWTSYAALMAALLGLLLTRGRGSASASFTGFAVTLSASMLALYGIPFYGASLAFAVADIAVYALIILILWIDLARLSLRRLVWLAAAFGAVIAHVELLTGQAPLALAVLVAAVGLRPADATRASIIQRCAGAAGAFAASFVLCFALKIAVVQVASHYDLQDEFVSALSFRMFGPVASVTAAEAEAGSRLGIDITQHAMYSPAAFAYLAAKLAYFSRVLGQGSLALGLAAIVLGLLGLVAGGWARWRRLGNAAARTQTTALIAAALVVPCWYLVFFQHTIIHASFMIRPLVATIAIGLWLGGCEALAALPVSWRVKDMPVSGQEGIPKRHPHGSLS